MVRTAILAMILAACGGGGGKSSTTPKAGPTCGAVADAMVAMMGEGKEATKAFVDRKEELATLVRTRCDADAWTADAKQCLATMHGNEDANRCATLLTDEQQGNLARDLDAKFGPPPAPAPAVEAPSPEPAAPTAAPPPPPANKAKEQATEPSKAMRSPAKKPKPAKDSSVTGDPCDGGE